MPAIKQRSNPQRHAHQVRQTYTIQAILPAFGLVAVSNTYSTPGAQVIQLAPLVSDTGSYGVHVTPIAGIDTIKQGSATGTGAVILGRTNQCLSPVLSAEQQTLGMYDTAACITATSSLYMQKIRGTLYAGIQSRSISLEVRGSQLQTSWQGDYSIRQVQSCCGLFVGDSMLVLEGGKFCSIGLSQNNCKVWTQALSTQVLTPNGMELKHQGQDYRLYTPYAQQALGYIAQSGIYSQDAVSSQGQTYMRLQQDQTQPSQAGVYRMHAINSAQLNMSIHTLMAPAQGAVGAVNQNTKLRVLRSQWLDYATGNQRIFSTACRVSITGTRAPGAMYWQPGVQAVQLQPQDAAKRARLSQLQLEYPAMFASLLQQQLDIPIQYIKAHKQLTTTRVLQYKDQQADVQLSSVIAQTPDGSVIIKDGSGSQIRMTGGNIYISAANDIYLQPRNNVLMMPGSSFACAAAKVQLSGSSAMSLVSGADVDIIAGAVPAGQTDSQSMGTVHIHGTDIAANATAGMYCKAAAFMVQGDDTKKGCSINVNAGKAGVTVYASDIHAKADNSLSGLVSGTGLYANRAQAVLSGDVCTCTGTLRLSRSPVLGLKSSSSHVILAQSALFAQCVVYGDMAVKRSIVCNNLGYYIAQGQQPKPPNKSQDNYAVQGTFSALQAMRVTPAKTWLPSESELIKFPQMSIMPPADGWNYCSYAYSWQHQLTQAEYHGLRILQPDADAQYTFPGKLQDTKFYTINADSLEVQQNTLQKFNIRK